MAKRKLKHQGQFKKGNKAAKGHGRKPVPPDVKEARALNQAEFTRLVTKYFYLTDEQIKQVWASDDVPQIEHLVMSMIQQARFGNHLALKLLLERTIGPVPEAPRTVDHNHNFNFANRPIHQVIEIGQAALQYLEEHKDDE